MSLLKRIVIKPGVIKDETELAAKPRWTDSDRIRFVRGLPQKLGGWIKHLLTAFTGTCRGLLGWQDASGVVRLAIGTHSKLLALEGMGYINITPFRSTGSLGTDPFTTTSGSPIVAVVDAAHALTVGDTVNYAGATTVGGLSMNGEFIVASLIDGGNYRVTHTSNATSSATGGGSSVTFQYEINIGRIDAVQGTGYGVGTYGSGTYGTARSTFIVLPPTIWTLEQWGEFLVACPRDGKIYEWQLNNAVRAQVLSNAPTDVVAIFVTEEKHLVALRGNMRLEWSDQDDNTVWSPSDQVTAGGRTLVGGSELLFGLRSKGTNLIFTDASVWTQTFLGGIGTGIFAFEQVAAGASGIISPRAAVDVDGVVYWMGLNDFYYFDGAVRRIWNSKDIRRFVFDNLQSLNKGKVFAFANTLFSEIWWLYTTETEINRYVKVNYDDWSWDTGTIVRTAGIDRGVFDKPILSDASSFLFDHESGVDDDTAAMNEFIQSSPINISDGDRIVEVVSVLPDFKDLQGSIDITILTRYYPQGREQERVVATITATTEKVDVRASGRQAIFEISSDITGTKWRLGTIPLLLEVGGQR